MPSTGKRHGEKARFRARMEELGEQQVRLLMSTGGLPMQLQPQILESLTEPLWSSLAGAYPAGACTSLGAQSARPWSAAGARGSE